MVTKNLRCLSMGALLLVGLAGCSRTPDLGTMPVVRIADEVVARPDSWVVVAGAAEAGVLTPAGDHNIDAGDLAAILMPPPGEVRFRVKEDVGAAKLHLAAGVDREVVEALGGATAKFAFEVRRGEEVVFQTAITIEEGQKPMLRGWRRPGRADDRGIACTGGDEFTLRTKQLSGPAAPGPEGWKIGFGGLRVETTEEHPRTAPSPEQPNIVLIVQDTLRFDRTSLGHASLDTTPHLAALATRGTSFTAAQSTSSWTWPSTASILTGLTPEVHGVTSRDSCYLASGNETLAEALQERGYTTGAFVRNPLIVQEKNFNQGFESFDDHHRFQKTDAIIDDIEAWLDANRERRFFLYLHLVDSHGPLKPLDSEVERLGLSLPPKGPLNDRVNQLRTSLLHGAGYNKNYERVEVVGPDELASLNDLYDASVATGDVYLGRLVGWLREAGLEDETLIAFTADHGEEWLDHGQIGHAHSLYQELVHVPLVVAGPGIDAGVVVTEPVANRRLAGSLAHVGQADLGTRVGSLGLKAFDLDPRPDEPVFTSTRYGLWRGHRDQQLFGVRIGSEVLVYCPTGRSMGMSKDDAPKEGQWSLYDLAQPGGEQRDLATERPERARELLDLLLASLHERSEAAASIEGAVQLGAGAETLDMLGRIGYIDD